MHTIYKCISNFFPKYSNISALGHGRSTCYNRLSFGDGYSNYVEFCFHNSNCTKAEEKELQKSCRCRLSFCHVVYVRTQQWAACAINATPILNREKRIRLQALLIYKHTFTSCGDISACAYIRNSTVCSGFL